jgi:alkylated DNA repair protein (DNA oxidative demethylase)
MTQAEFFAAHLLAGLEYRDGIMSEEEERALLGRLHALELAPFRFQGWTGNRKTQSFGWRYDFDDASFSPAEPIPTWLFALHVKAAAMARVEPADIAHVLIARYDPGAGIGWHKDRSVFEKVVGVSLNSPAVLRFRQRDAGRFRRFSLPVAPRSAYMLSGEARYDWEHRIVPGEELRFSITFRTLSDLGREKAARFQRSS